jgi:cyclophilin family peptidyl-prolyl cis-trans isomerase/HEAT repeat protein
MNAHRASHSLLFSASRRVATTVCALASTLLLATAQGQSPAGGGELNEATLGRILLSEDTRDSAPMLEMLANSADPALRARAALAIGRVGLPADIPVLVSALRDAAQEVREAAVFALGEAIDAGTLAEIGIDAPDKAAVDALLVSLSEDPSAEARRRAGEALGKSGAPAAIIPLATRALEVAEAASPSEEQIRDFELFAMALVRLHAVDSASLFHHAAKNSSARVRAAAAHAAWRLGDGSGVAIARELLGDADPLVRDYAARWLGAAGGVEDAAALAKAMSGDEAHGPRVSATRSLAAIGGPAGVTALRARFQELAEECLGAGGSAWVAANGAKANELVVAIDSLADVDPAGVALELLDRLRAQSDAVGLRALIAHAKISQRIGDPEGFMRFPEQFSAQSPESTRALAQALGEARSSEGLQLIGKMLSARGASLEIAARMKLVRPDLLESMSRYDVGIPVEFLLNQLGDQDLYSRVRAISLLAPEEGPPPSDELVDALTKAFKADMDVVPDGRLALLDALASRQDDARVTEMLAAAIKDVDRLVRMRTVRMLKLGSSPDLPVFLGGRGSVKRHLAGQISTEEFYRLIAERALQRRVFARIAVAGRGDLLLELFPADAPIAVENFVRLADRGYFTGQSFHRVVPNFVIQGGDPRQDMEGGPGYSIPCEINPRPFLRGTLGMALSGKDTGGSQFFICHSPQPRLDGGYTVFGQILPSVEGIAGAEALGEVPDSFSVLDSITQYDRIEEVKIYEALR